MNFENPKGIIELGNINIKCIIFNINNDNSSEILSTSTIKSEGIHNGVIVNLKKASSAIRSCVGIAEKKAEVLIKKINVIIEQSEFLCTKFSKHKKINGSKIHKDDIEFLLKEAKKQVISNDHTQSIIHIFNHNYIVDGKIFIEEPIDVYADHLSHEMTFITMPKNNVKNINQAFFECDIEVERIISSIFVLAVNYLNSNELKLGSILIDLGFEKTTLGMFKNLALVHSITFPIGINHLTKDISKVCSLSFQEAENIMKKIDFSFGEQHDLFDEKNNLKEIYFINSNFRKISKSLVLNVLKARMDEIFEIIKKQIVLSKLINILGANIFIVGGGSNISNLEKYLTNFFGSQVKKLSEKNKKEPKNNYEENFASCLGALSIIRDGWETEAIPETVNIRSQKTSFFSKIFGHKS